MVSSDNLYTFEVTEDAVYEAHFTIQTPTIYIDADPQEGGVVTGGGPYIYGETDEDEDIVWVKYGDGYKLCSRETMKRFGLEYHREWNK